MRGFDMGIDEKEMLGVTDDSIGKEMQEAQVESLKHQIELYNQSLASIDEQKEDYLAQCAIDEEVWAIRFRDGNHEKMDQFKHFKYELDPRYWELVRAKQEYEYRSLINQKTSTLKSFDFRKEELTKQLELTKEKLAEMGE
jgi:hypothetical protein